MRHVVSGNVCAASEKKFLRSPQRPCGCGNSASHPGHGGPTRADTAGNGSRGRRSGDLHACSLQPFERAPSCAVGRPSRRPPDGMRPGRCGSGPQTPAEFRRRVRPRRPVESACPSEKHGGAWTPESGFTSHGLRGDVGVPLVGARAARPRFDQPPRTAASAQSASGVGVRRRVPLWRGSRYLIRMRCGLPG